MCVVLLKQEPEHRLSDIEHGCAAACLQAEEDVRMHRCTVMHARLKTDMEDLNKVVE